MHPILTQFRANYPNGSLVAELLTIHQNNYVVRAIVQLGGMTLASGMATASTVEQAEDQAKIRALETLGLANNGVSHPAPTAYSLPSSLMAATIAPLPNLTPPPLPQSNPEAKSELPVTSYSEAEHTPAIPELPPLPDAPTPTPAVELPASSGKPAKRKATPAPEPVAVAQTTPLTESDRSDELARISVEMKRLGWSTEEGRSYLKRTYGKRSRQELEDEELLDFLRYLETQPSATPAPF